MTRIGKYATVLLSLALLAFAACDVWAKGARIGREAQKHVDLGRYVAEFRDYERAAAHYEMAVEKSPRSKTLLFTLGALYQKSADYAKAEKTYKKLLHLYPLDSDAHLCLGNLYLAQERADLAVKEFQQAADLNRDNADAYRNLGYAEMLGGAPYSAVQSLKKAVELDPTDQLAHFDLGMAYHQLGKEKLARKAFRSGLAIQGEGASDGKRAYTDVLAACTGERFEAARSAYRSNDFARAEVALKDLVREFPDYALPNAYLGHVLHHQAPPRPLEAEAAYRQALEALEYTVLEPDEYVFVLDNLGMLRMNMGDYAGAEELFRQAVAIGTDYPVAYFNYGCVLARRKQFEAAGVAFSDAVLRDRHFLEYVGHHAALKEFRGTAAYTNLVDSFKTEVRSSTSL